MGADLLCPISSQRLTVLFKSAFNKQHFNIAIGQALLAASLQGPDCAYFIADTLGSLLNE